MNKNNVDRKLFIPVKIRNVTLGEAGPLLESLKDYFVITDVTIRKRRGGV